MDVLLDSLNIKFDIIALTETKLVKNVEPEKEITLKDYNYESTATEATKEGTLIYISKIMEHKRRKDFELYEKRESNLPLLKLSIQKVKI